MFTLSPVPGKSIRVLILFLLSTQVWAQTIHVEPVFFGIHRSAGGLWQGASEPVSFAGWGLRGGVTQGPWSLQAEFINSRFFNLQGLPNRFSPEQGFSWEPFYADTSEGFDTDYSSMKMSYRAGGFEAFAGKFSQNWGPGLHSLTISSKPPTFPQFGFEWEIKDGLRFLFMHGDLFSSIGVSSYSDIIGSDVGEIYLDRYIAAHRLEWRLMDWLTLGLLESVVYGGRGMETIYLMPFVLYWSAEHYLGDTDNVQMSADVTLRLSPDVKLYGVFLMDEWMPERTFTDTNHNWFGWQAGLDCRSILREGDRLLAEATWTDHRIYRHRYRVNDLYSHGYPLGHWSGPHAQTFFAAYLFPWRTCRLMASYLYAQRGALTDTMLVAQYKSIHYDRFTGETETLQTIDITVGRPVWRKLWVELGVSMISWENSGFDPAEPEAGGTDVEKTSFTFGFTYNFDLPGYNITLLQGQ